MVRTSGNGAGGTLALAEDNAAVDAERILDLFFLRAGGSHAPKASRLHAARGSDLGGRLVIRRGEGELESWVLPLPELGNLGALIGVAYKASGERLFVCQ